jgi:UDP-glucose 4-epimerase
MKIWITGIAGFLGSHLADALIAEWHEVDGNDSLICGDRKNPSNQLSYAYTDCRNFDAMKAILCHFKPDVLIHCAATAHEGLSSFSPSFITKNIYEASVATFSAAIASGVKRIVYMSSMSRYGHGYGYLKPPFTEEMPTAPVDPYGIAKVAAEETLKVLAKTHGIKYAIAVPHNIIGIRQRSVDPYRNVAAIMINRCKQDKAPIIYGDGSQKRCFSPVKDCISSIIKMVNGDADGEVVNIGPDNSEMTILELAEMITELTDCHQDIIYMPGRPNEVKEAFCSSDKARQLLGYKPQQKMRDCLKEMVGYIKPEPFIYDFPIEISEGCPKTWTEKLM